MAVIISILYSDGVRQAWLPNVDILGLAWVRAMW